MIQDFTVYEYRCGAAELVPDIGEVYRYLGLSQSARSRLELLPPETPALIEDCIRELQPLLGARSVYACFPLVTGSLHEPSVMFAGYRISGTYLFRNLQGCTRVILLAATVGARVDACIRRYIKRDAARAAVLQAAGAMFTETFVDVLNQNIARQAAADGWQVNPRYSPGYGDVPLDTQRIFFSLLPCTSKIGLTLTDSLVMAPEKSVTAFIGMRRM